METHPPIEKMKLFVPFSPENKRASYYLLIKQFLPKPLEYYNEYGLRFPIEALENPFLEVVTPFLPLDWMAEYGDVIGRNMVDSKEAKVIEDLAESILTLSIDKERINVTAWGNMAYFMLNNQDHPLMPKIRNKLRNDALKHFKATFEKYQNMLKDVIYFEPENNEK